VDWRRGADPWPDVGVRVAFLISVALVGCGSAPYRYEAGCLAAESEIELPYAETLLGAAAIVLERRGLVADGELCRTFGPARTMAPRIVVTDRDLLSDADEPRQDGWFSMGTGIVLTRDMHSLAHELLHALDSAHISPGTMWHQGWDANGYDDAAGAFSGFASALARDGG
jgi:hypothetical protein